MVDVAAARVVALLTRAPSSGGKTRVFDALGRAPDPNLLTALLLDTLDAVALPGITRVVSVTPASACAEIVSLVPDDVSVVPQSDGNLGERMRGVFASLAAGGARAVAMIGSDVPEVTPAIVARAFAVLERDPGALVLGPAADGGYYLVAATGVPEVFTAIAWSTDAVLSQTLTAAASAGLRVTLLDRLSDVDTPDDLRRVAERLPASRTAAWLKDARA
jgi:rSAM/selenodomain-associated transferase 1